MAEKDFKLETKFTDSEGAFPYVAAALGIVGILVIVLTMTTGVAARLLPMKDSYLTVLIPVMPDGSEPLSLQMLDYESKDNVLSVHGIVLNRTMSTISGLLAVIEVRDRFGLSAQTVTAPLEPAEFLPQATATFHTSVMLDDRGLGGYSVRFRLPDEGPFVPHKDERPLPPSLVR